MAHLTPGGLRGLLALLVGAVCLGGTARGSASPERRPAKFWRVRSIWSKVANARISQIKAGTIRAPAHQPRSHSGRA